MSSSSCLWVSEESRCHAGAKELPHECLVLGLATRMVQYCIGPGAPVSPGLAAGFLRLLRQLMARCVEEAESVAAPEGRGSPHLTHSPALMLYSCGSMKGQACASKRGFPEVQAITILAVTCTCCCSEKSDS